MENDSIDMLAGMFREMGAADPQAMIMAQQLWKRAGQLSEEQGVSPVEALEGLLKRMQEVRLQHGDN